MKIVTTLCLLLLTLSTYSQIREEDIVHEFVKKTYQRRMTQNYALAALTQVPEKVKDNISFDPEKDQELFDAIVGFVERKVQKDAANINARAFSALNYDKEFLKTAAEEALDKLSVKEMGDLLEKGITDDNVWIDQKGWERAVDAARQTTNMSISVMEKNVENLVEETIAALPADRGEQLVFLRADIDPLQQANEAWQQLSYGFLAYANDNPDSLKDQNGKILPKCWAPDNKLRDHMSRVKFLDVSFQCFRIEENGEAAYGYFPLPLVEYCLANNAPGCLRIFSESQLAQIGGQIDKYNKE